MYLGSTVLRLKALLYEKKEIGEKATDHGLTDAGYGKWADATGRVVAHTIDGKLVDTRASNFKNPQYATEADDQKAKPKGTSAEKAGMGPDRRVRPVDAQKAAGNSPSPNGQPPAPGGQPQQPGGQQQQQPQFTPPPFEVGKPITTTDAFYTIPEDYDMDKRFIGRILAEEEPTLVRIGELEEFLKAQDDKSQVNEGDTQWKEQLPPAYKHGLMAAEMDWKRKDPFQRDTEQRDKLNNVFNAISKRAQPRIKVEGTIERGTVMDVSKLKEFAGGIHIGEDYDFPPSGFSSPAHARQVLNSQGDRDVGVLIRVAPNGHGEVHGIRLSDGEVVRAAGSKARCVGIKKLLTPVIREGNKKALRVTYVLDFVDTGHKADIGLHHTHDGARFKVFSEVLNTPFEYAGKAGNHDYQRQNIDLGENRVAKLRPRPYFKRIHE